MQTDEWVLFDTETDGLCSPIHVIDLAAQRFKGFEPVGNPIQLFINHGITIPSDATAIHGYTTEFIHANGIPPDEAYKNFREFVGDASLSSHYLSFDWDRVITHELIRLNLPAIGTRGFCSCLLSRRALPEHPTYQLDFLRQAHGLRCSSRPHTALGDVESVVDLLTRIIFPRLRTVGLADIRAIAAFSVVLESASAASFTSFTGLSYQHDSHIDRTASGVAGVAASWASASLMSEVGLTRTDGHLVWAVRMVVV